MLVDTMPNDLLTRFALLLKRLAAANYSLDVGVDIDLPEAAALELDSLSPIPGLEATGIIPKECAWDGFVEVVIALRDLGLSRDFVRPLEPCFASHDDRVLMVDALLRHRVPFSRWSTSLAPELWSRVAVRKPSERIEVALTDEALVFRFDAARIARTFQDHLKQAASEGGEA